MKKTIVKAAFIIPVLWWVYLFFATQIVVVFDSEVYESAGQLIHLHGWQEFLRAGPQREPFFSALIALSMWLGDIFQISYYYPLKIFGLLFLFSTMLVSYRLMRMLSIDRVIAAIAVFYMGISPVMTNSSIRLWSEFAVYPWIVLAIWWTVKSWQSLMEKKSGERQEMGHTVFQGAILAGLFLLIMSVKAAAEPILIVYLWPFYWQAFIHWRNKNYFKMKHILIFCLTIFVIFEGVLAGYKGLNYLYNGQYTYTTRWDWALWGYAERRAEPLTLKSLEAAVLFVPGTEVCSSILGQEACDFWSARHSDDMDVQKRAPLIAQGLTDKEISQHFIKDSLKAMLDTPLQQIGLIFIEAHKIFFWESAVAFVAYPDWLENTYYINPGMKVLKYGCALLSWLACLYAIFYLCRRKITVDGEQIKQNATVLFVLNFIVWYTAAYAMYFIIDRYSFPMIAPLIILIAFMVQRVILSLKRTDENI